MVIDYKVGVLISILSIGSFCSTSSSSEGPLKSIEQEDGWRILFDGKSLTGWEETKFGGEGPVGVSDGAIILHFGDNLTGITWQGDFPREDYEIALEAQRVEGSDFFCGMTFPVGDSFCSLILGGWAGSVVGISNVDGLDASENETTRLKRFENGLWYRVRLRVTVDRLEAWIDQEKVIDLSTKGRGLSVRPEVRLSRPFGIASWQTTAALRDIRLRSPLPVLREPNSHGDSAFSSVDAKTAVDR